MARTILVTPELLKSSSKKIKDLADTYQQSYNKLYMKADEMGSTWSGKDNTAYINQIKGFEDDFQKMYNLMVRYSEFLQKSAETYEKTQNSVVSDAKRLYN